MSVRRRKIRYIILGTVLLASLLWVGILHLSAEKTEETQKYKESSLGDEEKQRLHDSIQDVMETSDEIFQPEFSLDKLSELSGGKPKHVSQTIAETFGKNFNSLLAFYRIREACRILSDPERSSKMTLEAVALDLGFKSRSHFAVVFKRETGLSPGEYVKANRRVSNEEKQS